MTDAPFATGPSAAAPAAAWVQLLGRVQVHTPQGTLQHWPSRAAAALLARLVMQPQRDHPREELIELLWPGVAPTVGRNRFRQTLSTLRALLQARQPPGLECFVADRHAVRLRPGALGCDALVLVAALQRGDTLQARALYQGPFMPGHYDDWVVSERQRLEDAVTEISRLPWRTVRHASTGLVSPAPVADPWQAPFGASTQPPLYWTEAFGLAPAVQAVTEALARARLVTLVGPGGSGKTRLACAVAQQAARLATPAQPEPTVRFFSLAACLQKPALLEALCQGLGLGAAQAHPAGLIRLLSLGRCLWVLDNLEQLPPSALGLVSELLRAAPGLQILATSQRRLNLEGEHLVEVMGLPAPSPDAGWDEVSANPAVALFVDRARASRAEFHLHERNAPAVASLVRELGGLPLAIELAAARVRAMALPQLLQQLQSGAGCPTLDLLVRHGSAADARHASMRAVMAWSWGLLSAPQAELLAWASALGVPAEQEALAAVAAEAFDPAALMALVDACLVQAQWDDDAQALYHLPTAVREWAIEQLGEQRARLGRCRLRAWLLTRAVRVDRSLLAQADLAPRLPLVCSALAQAGQDDDALTALRLVAQLRPLWDREDLPQATLAHVEALLPRATDPNLRCELFELLAHGRHACGQTDWALVHAQAACAEPADERRRCLARLRWVRLQLGAGRPPQELAGALAEAGALAQASGSLLAQAEQLRLQAVLAGSHGGDPAAAEVFSAQAQALWEQLGDTAMVLATRQVRARWWAASGRLREALIVAGQCEAAFTAQGDALRSVQAARDHGRLLLAAGRWEDGEQALLRSLNLAWERRWILATVHTLLHLPLARACGPNPQQAAWLRGGALALWARLGAATGALEARELRRARHLLRQRLGAQQAQHWGLLGSSATLAEVVAAALAPGAQAG